MTHFLTAVHTWPYHRLVEGSSNYKWNVGDRNNNWQTALGRVFFDKGYQRSPPYHLGLRTQEGLLRPWTHWINNNKSLGQLMIININYYAAHQSFSNLPLLLLNHMRGASYRNSLEFFGEWTKKMQMSWLAWYQDLRAKRGMNRVKITRVCISFTLSTWSCNWGMFSYPFGCPAPTIHAASHSFLVWLSIVPSRRSFVVCHLNLEEKEYGLLLQHLLWPSRWIGYIWLPNVATIRNKEFVMLNKITSSLLLSDSSSSQWPRMERRRRLLSPSVWH